MLLHARKSRFGLSLGFRKTIPDRERPVRVVPARREADVANAPEVARRDRGAGSYDELYAFLVDHVGVIDDVDPRLSALDNALSARAVSPHHCLPVMRFIDRCHDFFFRHVIPVGNDLAAVPITDRELHNLTATTHFFAHRQSHFLNAAHVAGQPRVLDSHVPRPNVAIGGVARRNHFPCTRDHPRADC